jgi:Chalcone isomerase-like
LAAVLLAGSMVAESAPAGGTPAHVRKYVETVTVQGHGRLTWFGFHVYDAQLFAGAGFDTRTWAGQPFVLELTYARKLEGSAIADASRDEMQRMNLGSAEEQARWLTAMRGIFPNVDKGSRIAGVNVPGRGARFYVDGNFVGSVDDPAFARAFFSIWLDERTRAPKLRENLLAARGGST